VSRFSCSRNRLKRPKIVSYKHDRLTRCVLLYPSCQQHRQHGLIFYLFVRRFAKNYARFNHQQPYWNANGTLELVIGLLENLKAVPPQNHARPYHCPPQTRRHGYHRRHQVRLRQIRTRRKSTWNTYAT